MAIFAIPTLELSSKASNTDASNFPCFSESDTVWPATFQEPPSKLTREFKVTLPSSNADNKVTNLNVDPGSVGVIA